jgi:SAM-dependent methyltransferase
MLKHFDKGTVVEFSPEVMNVYKQLPANIQQKLTIIVGDFFKQKFDKKFECIVSCEVLEHIEEDVKFLRKTNELLGKNGQLLISVPAKDKYWTIHDDVVGHLRRYDKEQLTAVLKESGFVDIKILSYGYPFINILWRLRKVHGQRQSAEKKNWSKKKQTQESGIGQISSKFNFVGVFVNKYTFFIPNLLSTLFDKLDLSEGYVATARKS